MNIRETEHAMVAEDLTVWGDWGGGGGYVDGGGG
jgi:hypothetical protein